MATININNLNKGVDRNISPDTLDIDESPLLNNVTLDNRGNISHRLGDNLIGDDDTSPYPGESQGGSVYIKGDGTYELLRVNGGSLEKYNSGTDDWDLVQAAIYDSASQVNFANYLGNLYMVGSISGEFLKKYDGSSVTTVSGSIRGKYVASGGTRLAVGGDDTNPRRILYTEVNSEIFDTTNNVINLDEPNTAITSLGEASPFLGFSEQFLYILDLDRGFSRKIKSAGCTSHRTLQVLHANAIWLGYEGIWRFNGVDAYPVKISEPLENFLTNDGYFNVIADFRDTAAGVLKNKYYLSVGDLTETIDGKTYDDCYLVYDILVDQWVPETHTVNGAGAWFTNWLLDNKEIIVSGSRDDKSVYQIHTPGKYGDDDNEGEEQLVAAFYRSKYHEFGGTGSKYAGPENMKVLDRFFIKIYAPSALSITYLKDGSISSSPTSWVTSTSTTPANTLWHWDEVLPFANSDMRALIFEIGGTGNWIFYEYGFNLTAKQDTNLPAI